MLVIVCELISVLNYINTQTCYSAGLLNQMINNINKNDIVSPRFSLLLMIVTYISRTKVRKKEKEKEND